MRSVIQLMNEVHKTRERAERSIQLEFEVGPEGIARGECQGGCGGGLLGRGFALRALWFCWVRL